MNPVDFVYRPENDYNKEFSNKYTNQKSEN